MAQISDAFKVPYIFKSSGAKSSHSCIIYVKNEYFGHLQLKSAKIPEQQNTRTVALAFMTFYTKVQNCFLTLQGYSNVFLNVAACNVVLDNLVLMLF